MTLEGTVYGYGKIIKMKKDTIEEYTFNNDKQKYELTYSGSRDNYKVGEEKEW